MQMSDRWTSPHFVIFVLLPVLFAIFLMYEAWQWLQRSWPVIHGYVIAGVVALILVGLTWTGWRAYKSVSAYQLQKGILQEQLLAKQYHNDIAEQNYRLLQDACINNDDVEFKYASDGSLEALRIARAKPLPSQGRVIDELREQIQQLASQQTLALPAPDTAIPDVVDYDDVSDDIPRDKSLLGIHPDDGSLELTDYERLKCMWVVGSSSSGKSNTVFGRAREAVEKGAKLLVIDQHAEKDDSLARKLAPYSFAFLRPVAQSDDQVLDILDFYKTEFERRINGAPRDLKIVLIADEMNRMNRNEKLKKALQEIVFICGEEARGFGMYGWFISQKCVGLKWLRDSAITVIVHRLARIEEAMLACNDDRHAARELLKFKVGRTFVYGMDYDEPMVLQQARYRVPVVDSTAYVDRSQSVPSNQATMLMERLQERAQEADGTQLHTASFELKKLLSEVARLKAEGKSNAEILKQYNLHASGRNNTNLSVLIGLIGDTGVEDGVSK